MRRPPFGDASFDVVLSTFGVMFTPDQERTAAGLRRVCRPGGRIGLANWTPDSFIGQLFRLLGSLLPPPAGLRSTLLWGSEARLGELFPGNAVEVTPSHFNFRYRSAGHFVEVFRNVYGPTHKAFAALDEEARPRLEQGILALLREADRGGRGLAVPSAYLEAVIRPVLRS